MDWYRKVRLAFAEGISKREAAQHFGVSRDSIRKILAFLVPTGDWRAAARTNDDLWRAACHVCDLFTDEECYSFFKAAGYETS